MTIILKEDEKGAFQMSIESINFGEVLNSLRTYKKIEIAELAEGICTPEDIELFEKERKYPTMEQLAKIAEKLNVQINYLFDYTASSRFNYVITISKLINNYKRERNYQAIYEIIQKEKNNPIFRSLSQQQFLLWHEGICVFYLENNKELAIELLKKAIKLTNPKYRKLTENEVDILASMAIIEKDAQNFEEALSLFLEALNHIRELPYIKDPTLEIKILYGYSQLLTKVGEYEESLKYCKVGIKACIGTESSYQFADLHYQAGENYIRLGQLEKGNEYMEKAINLFNIQGNDEYVLLVKKEHNKLLTECVHI